MNAPKYCMNRPDQARLKVARTEIEAVLKKHDLGGLVVLHTPGMTEFFYDIRPSYSCAWIDENAGALRLKSKLADYGGDAQAQRAGQAATAQLLHALAIDSGKASAMFLEVSAIANKALRAEHYAAAEVTPDPMESKLQ